jgi:hypothetical protein
VPTDLWGRVGEGPQLAPLGPPRRSRVVAGVTALAMFAVAAALVWRVFAPPGGNVRTLAGPDVVAVPARGDVAPVFLPDGRPVFVAHHEDGTVSVIDAFSSHRPYGLEDLVAWCPSTRDFVEIAHEARFDELGSWHTAGPAPGGLATFAFEVVERDTAGDPASIRVGEILDPSSGGSAPETDPSTYPPFCPAEDGPSVTAGTTPVLSGVTEQVGDVVRHTIDRADVWASPAEVVAADPDGWIVVGGRLLVSRSDGFVQLCAEVDGERCIDGAIVRGIDGVGLLVNVLIPSPGGFYAEEPGIWIGLVEDGVLLDIGRID